MNSSETPTTTCSASLSLSASTPIKLTDRQKKMVVHLKESEGKTSPIAVGYFSLSCFGKLTFGFGASLTVKGSASKHIPIIVAGSVLCVIGFTCILNVALGFGAACAKVDRKRAIILKLISISSSLLIALGYALDEYFISVYPSLLGIRLSFFPLFLGASLLMICISNFFAYTELVRGVTPFSKSELRKPALRASQLKHQFPAWGSQFLLLAGL